MKAFVEALQRLPDRPFEHEKCSGRLFRTLAHREVRVEGAVPLVHRIAGPQSVYANAFENKRHRCGEAANRKAGLILPFRIDQPSPYRPDAGSPKPVDHRRERRQQSSVRIQEEDEFGPEGVNALIDCGGEAAILRIRNELNRIAAGNFASPVRGAVIDDNHPRALLQGGLQAGRQYIPRVVRYNQNAELSTHRCQLSRKYSFQ